MFAEVHVLLAGWQQRHSVHVCACVCEYEVCVVEGVYDQYKPHISFLLRNALVQGYMNEGSVDKIYICILYIIMYVCTW